MPEPILIVDDNAVNLELASFTLEAAGYSVHRARNADEALAALTAHPVRLVLMDLQLPGVTGLDLTRQLKADPRYAGLKVVAMTSYAMKGDEEKARQAGCDGYITKPIDTRTFADTVAGFLQAGGAG